MSQPSSDLGTARSRRRRWPWVAGAVVVLLVLLGGGGYAFRQHQAQLDDDAAAALAQQVAKAVSAGDVSTLPVAGGGAAALQQADAATLKGLGKATTSATVKSEQRTGDSASVTLAVTRTLPGGVAWHYDLPVQLTKTSTWQVPADARLVHPDVAAGEKLKLSRTQPDRADIETASGAKIVSMGDVVDVGIQPGRVTGSVPALTAKVADIVGVDGGELAKRVSAADKDAFVDVITLRRSDYDAVRSSLRPLPGVVLHERQQPLAPTKEFARALLGTVGPVTAEIVEQGKGRYAAGDVAGVFGLQRQYDEQLGGTAGTTVEAVAADGTTRPLLKQAAEPGTPLKLTLDPSVQKAADAALVGQTQPSALVAVDVRTGRVLAVANSPASGLDRALVGRYSPGSTFKVVTTYSLLGKGLTPTDAVNCPPNVTVDGRSFKNYEDEKFGSVPFRTDFAKSCNTAFVGLSSRLGNADLAAAGKALGIGQQWDLGTSAFSGNVPTNNSDVDKAAAAFGQGRTEVSPLSVAVATASVARGSYLAPTLVLADGAATAKATPLDAGSVSTLRSLMRSVVTSGTGTALKSVPGGPVYAKTGTAEFGSGAEPKTRAWITGWQGNIAFAVLVEEGKSGGTVAGPVAAKFLTTLANG
ncbi:penicillin-binding transpeptidase domain-containing protein [Angustibacter sp. McL0619]|uniref:penicillin-binding transpeptidase domain-containing protein n=1 Tax=Angustibacter sp. McL0619 TaxID=3415676 RepID=UPI003CF5050E